MIQEQETGSGSSRWDSIFVDATVATMSDTSTDSDYGLITDAAIGIKDQRISWCGRRVDLPATPEQLADTVISCKGSLITPGLIDCHTHLVYAGNRAREFELRLEGASYEQIARAGGGIVSTVQATRAASEFELLESAEKRLLTLLKGGTTSVEIKSGYGLNTETELKMLRVARQLGESNKVRVRTSFLGAHALPVEYKDRSDAYIDLVCDEMIPAVAESGLADAVDGFCENIGFTAAQIERVFVAAKNYNLPVKLHAEQLSDQKGAVLAAKYGALSVDHLEYLNEEDINSLAKSATIPVLLPGAYYFLRETQLPPLKALRESGLPIALATDLNPGSSPVMSLLLIMNMACTFFRFTPQQALAGVTSCAAQALGISSETGTVGPGKCADLAIWDVDDPAELAYRIGDNPLKGVVTDGHYREIEWGFREHTD